jgi:hypothetical protein
MGKNEIDAPTKRCNQFRQKESGQVLGGMD